MSGRHRQFAELVSQARRERIPPLDVSARVAHSLQPRVSARAAEWPLWIAAALSVTAALVMLGVALQQGVLFSDPLADCLRPFVLVMQ